MDLKLTCWKELTLTKETTARNAFRRLASQTIRTADTLLPHTNWIDGRFRRFRFWQANQRLPRSSGDPAATFNDLILERMIRDDWTPLERACIDKEYAKLIAVAICPSVRTAETKLIIPLAGDGDGAHAFDILRARAGRSEVAKPTHGSGSVLFLRDSSSSERIRNFCKSASRSYHASSRESQYKGLARKIIVEEDLSGASGPPEDYKFFCSHGEVLFCQVDVGRFTQHRRLLVTPGFDPIGVRFAYDCPEIPPAPPPNFDDMLRAARELSRLFAFVRIDLYAIGNTVCFGEFTFAPEGGAGALSSEAFGIGIMEKIRRRMQAQEGKT
jgi:hypothetical protein